MRNLNYNNYGSIKDAITNLAGQPNTIRYCIICNKELSMSVVGIRAHLRSRHLKFGEIAQNEISNLIAAIRINRSPFP